MARRRGLSSGDVERAVETAQIRTRPVASSGDTDDDWDFFIYLFFGIAIAFGVVCGVLGFLDKEFGWGLLPYFKAWIHNLMHHK